MTNFSELDSAFCFLQVQSQVGVGDILNILDVLWVVPRMMVKMAL